jgi:hypothetical protein
MQQQRVPYNELAMQKVRKYVPPIKEKATLIAIAGHHNIEKDCAWPSIKLLAHESGQSIPTIKRHIKKLEADGYLIVDRPSRREHRPSVYRITCCSFSIEELEFITGIDSEQLVLGIVDPETAGETVVGPAGLKAIAERKSVSGRYLLGVNVLSDQYQTDTLTPKEPHTEQELRLRLLENAGVQLLSKEKRIEKLATERPDLLPYLPAGRVSPEDAQLITERNKARAAIGLGKERL